MRSMPETYCKLGKIILLMQRMYKFSTKLETFNYPPTGIDFHCDFHFDYNCNLTTKNSNLNNLHVQCFNVKLFDSENSFEKNYLS